MLPSVVESLEPTLVESQRWLDEDRDRSVS